MQDVAKFVTTAYAVSGPAAKLVIITSYQVIKIPLVWLSQSYRELRYFPLPTQESIIQGTVTGTVESFKFLRRGEGGFSSLVEILQSHLDVNSWVWFLYID